MALHTKSILMATLLVTTITISACGGNVNDAIETNTDSQDTEQTIEENSTNTEDSEDETVIDDGQNVDDLDSGNTDNDDSNSDNSSGQENDSSDQSDTSDDLEESDETDGNDTGDNEGSTENDAGQGDQSENDVIEDSDSEQSGDSDTNNDCSATVWDSAATYVDGDQVVHNEVLYQAKWWTQSEPPANEWQQLDTGCSEAEDTNNDSGSQTNDDAIIVDNLGDMVVASYFVEWGVYGRNYHVADIPAEKLTHILYGFIPICGPNDSLQTANPSGHSILVSQCSGKPDYSVVVHDKYAALEKSYPGDNWDDPIKGNFGQFIKLKQQYPHLKIIPSVGGWTFSDPFYYFANDPQKRAVFVSSVIDFIKQYSFFDGIDIDWEYPGGNGANTSLGDSADYQGYADLMRDLRAALDDLEIASGREYELTSAVGAAPSKIDAVNYSEAQNYMDYIFAMTYDYYGAWNNTVGHLTALNDYPENVETGFYAVSAVNQLMAAGVPANKIVVGAAMYGRGWDGVQVAADESILNGVGNGPAEGSWEPGSVDYKEIVDSYLGGSDGRGINGFTYYYDEIAQAPYVFNADSGVFITYDNPRSVKAKGSYVLQNNLGGLFSWEIDADNGDILNAMNDGLGNPLEVKVSQ